MNFSTLCTILVAFGPETSEFTLLTIAPFIYTFARWQHGYVSLLPARVKHCGAEWAIMLGFATHFLV